MTTIHRGSDHLQKLEAHAGTMGGKPGFRKPGHGNAWARSPRQTQPALWDHGDFLSDHWLHNPV